MANIALVCPPLAGHLHPTATLGRALQRRGHTVMFFHIPGFASQVSSQRLPFQPVGREGTDLLAQHIRQLSSSTGIRSLKFAIRCSCECSAILCRNLPAAFLKQAIDLVIADQNEPAASTVAEHLGLPFINICPSLPLNREPDIPPPFFGWKFGKTAWHKIRNFTGYYVADRLISPINETINRFRRQWGLRKISEPGQSLATLGQLCQMTSDFDFPRQALTDCFHYLGPFVEPSCGTSTFPFERLDGRPIIYASLGTLQDENNQLLRMIAKGCQGIDGQLVLASGGVTRMNLESDLPKSAVLVNYAPQLELLSRASLTITHAGMNTVMQSLMFGTPMVALPITHDQPAIAARVKRSGTGEVIPAANVTPERLAYAVRQVMSDSTYRQRAQLFSDSIARAGGVDRAASIVEHVLARGSPYPEDETYVLGQMPSPRDAFRNC